MSWPYSSEPLQFFLYLHLKLVGSQGALLLQIYTDIGQYVIRQDFSQKIAII